MMIGRQDHEQSDQQQQQQQHLMRFLFDSFAAAQQTRKIQLETSSSPNFVTTERLNMITTPQPRHLQQQETHHSNHQHQHQHQHLQAQQQLVTFPSLKRSRCNSISPISSAALDAECCSPPVETLRRAIDEAKMDILHAIEGIKREPINLKRRKIDGGGDESLIEVESSSDATEVSPAKPVQFVHNEMVAIGGEDSRFALHHQLLEAIQRESNGSPVTFARKLLHYFSAASSHNNQTSGLNNKEQIKPHHELTSDDRLLRAVSIETMTRFRSASLGFFQAALKSAVEKRLYSEEKYRRQTAASMAARASSNNSN